MLHKCSSELDRLYAQASTPTTDSVCATCEAHEAQRYISADANAAVAVHRLGAPRLGTATRKTSWQESTSVDNCFANTFDGAADPLGAKQNPTQPLGACKANLSPMMLRPSEASPAVELRLQLQSDQLEAARSLISTLAEIMHNCVGCRHALTHARNGMFVL